MSTAAKTRRQTAAGYVRLFADTKAMLVHAKASATELGAPQLRVQAMVATLELLRKLINLATGQRARIKLGTAGLTQLDRDLAGLRARFQGLYGRWDPADMDPPQQWDADV